MSDISLSLIQQAMKVKTMPEMAIISTIFAQMLSESGGYQEVYEKLKSLLTSLEQTLFKNL
jgi:predicted chitinase